jgi:hypothetical protein
MEIFLGDFNVEVGWEDFVTKNCDRGFTRKDNDHEITVVNFATSRNLIVNVQRSQIVTFIN